MLSTIREKTQGWIAGIILGLLAIPFALWGINYYFEGSGRVDVATVNGTHIGADAYRRALDEQRRALSQLLGRGADPRVFDTPAFHERVLDALVDQVLLSEDVDTEGYKLSDAELARQIRGAPQLLRDGQFDPRLYEAFVRARGMDVRSFEAGLRHDVLLRQAESGYVQSAIVTDSEVAALVALQAQQREVAVATLRPARLRDRVKVGNEAIEQEYNAHPERYRTQERARIEYLRLSVDDLAKQVHVSDAELRQALDEAAQAAGAKEERRASHILVKLAPNADAAAEKAAMAKIQALRTRLTAGADFASLAKQNSEDPGSATQGGDLGFVVRGALDKAFEKALFALGKPGELSAPVRTSYGLHLIKLTGIKSGASIARPRVETQLRARKAEQRFFELSEKFQNLVYEQPDSLKPAAEALGLKIETSGWFTRAGTGSGLTGDAKVLAAAFDPDVLEQGHNSSALDLGGNTLVALRVAGHEPARVRPLAEVRADIEKALVANAEQAEAGRLAEEMLGKLKDGAAFETLARQYGMDYQAPRVYGRKTTGQDAALLQALFRTTPDGGKPAYGQTRLADGSVAVFAVTRVVEPEKLALDGPEAVAIRRQLEQRRGPGYFDDYRAGLRQQAKIKIFKDQL